MFKRPDLFNEIIGTTIILLSFMLAWLLMDYHRFTFTPLPLDSQEQLFELKPGSSIHSVSRQFEAKGWIRFAEYLRLYARLNQLDKIKAGEYRVQSGQSAVDLLKDFTEGKVILHALTLIEGWNIHQVLDAVRSDSRLQQTLGDVDPLTLMQALDKPDLHPEGQFLPDTYHFNRDTRDLDLLLSAHQSLQDTLMQAWEQRDEGLPLKTPYEALTLASIVEKETGVASERPLIAGVFITRLRKGMKLQTDPTVIYGMGERFDGNIRRKDLREDTPYNTYVHKGLTPTPISMPGKAAIEAVMHPQEEGYIFFVSRGDGSHKFSRTLTEHNAAVRKYQLKK